MSITRQFGTWAVLLYVTHSCTLGNYVNYGKGQYYLTFVVDSLPIQSFLLHPSFGPLSTLIWYCTLGTEMIWCNLQV
ncbi:hypothetical protein BDV30DRAFT_216349, partial [Aspergillus minisclerotigenes]